MNKIKEAFSTITVSEQLKEKTYSALKNRKIKKSNVFTPIIFINTALALMLILVFNYNNIEDNKLNTESDNAGVLSVSALSFNSFTYNGNNYIKSDIVIRDSLLDINLGSFSDLVATDSKLDEHQDYLLYTVKDNDSLLVVKDGSNLYSFEKK